MRLLPTPMARTQSGTQVSGDSRTGGPMLEEALKLLPTPTEGDSTNSRSATSTRKTKNFRPGTTLSDVAYEWSGGLTVQQSAAGSAFTGLRLNPSFVEWMMGAPVCGECGRGWTDSDCPHSVTAYTSTSAGSSARRSP
jgi:hypothetical protein